MILDRLTCPQTPVTRPAVLYTIAILSAHFHRRLKRWMIAVFAAALALDVAGTFLLCVRESKSLEFTFHTVSGFLSLAIMALHFVWALGSLFRQRVEAHFHRWSLLAWLIWLASFFSGLCLR